MKGYIIVSGTEIPALEKEVIRKLNEGWKLAGGISMVYKHVHTNHGHVPGHVEYAQALEKDGE